MLAPRPQIGLKRTPGETPATDPRRAYDRGAWAAESGEGDPAHPAHSALANVPTELLRREIERRQRGVEALLAKREALRAEIAELEAHIRELEDADHRPGRGVRAGGKRAARLALPRPKNAINLPDAIALEVEVGQTVTPAEAARRVLASGYQTKARTFTMVVTNALSKDKRFQRIGRGMYERVA